MTLPDPLLSTVTTMLRRSISDSLSILNYSPASGGCINNGGRLTTAHGSFFIKWNNALRFPGMFEAEAKGLKILAEPNIIDIPRVINTGECGGLQYIIMTYVDQRAPSSEYWKIFGEQLARLHHTTTTKFGLDHNNYIGSLPQANNFHSSWIDFFIQRRLVPQIDLAVKSGAIGTSMGKKFTDLFNVLPSLIVEEKPALLHGDLWSGNLMINEDGLPSLIDPAVYYGSREADLAMTQLFGGFNSTFIDAYHQTFPLSGGFEERIDLYNLYPLLVHVNLFGGSYVNQVQSILKRYVG
jgi:protein-ribulosamine 3-kinase